ncbi:MAG TPA: FHA domain-containing protein [Pyrinomonadaceae bacterium]|nr:FHA domain-containing protein [Pyrinomonadaceae bacterium]
MITCERCQTENVDGAQYCDECGLLLASAGAAGASAGADARTPILQMLNKPVTLVGDSSGDGASTPEVISPDAPTKHDGTSGAGDGAAPTPVAVSEAASALRASGASGASGSKAASRITPVAPAAPATRGTGTAGAHAAHAALVINRGRSAGKEFPVHEDEAYIGRWDADSGIFPDVDLDSDDPEAKVSRRHARITRRGGQYYIEDLGSTNGTFINRGRRLLPGDRQPLHDGDEIIIGKTFLRFHVTK